MPASATFEVLMLKNGLLVAMCLTAGQSAWAQQAPVGAGGLLQQIPQAPTSENPPP
jgi:hypothetical protein